MDFVPFMSCDISQACICYAGDASLRERPGSLLAMIFQLNPVCTSSSQISIGSIRNDTVE